MADPKNLEVIMELIVNAGQAKSEAVEAIRAAKNYNFAEAEEKQKLATSALNIAHNAQTGLLTQEATGEKADLSLLMVHGQDHLMTALTFIDMAKEIIDVYRELHNLRENNK